MAEVGGGSRMVMALQKETETTTGAMVKGWARMGGGR